MYVGEGGRERRVVGPYIVLGAFLFYFERVMQLDSTHSFGARGLSGEQVRPGHGYQRQRVHPLPGGARPSINSSL